MSNTCGTCKFWGGHHPDEDMVRFKHHPCERIRHDSNCDATPSEVAYESWDEEALEKGMKRMATVTDSAVVQDGSGYHAALKTREDFGCIYWMAKE